MSVRGFERVDPEGKVQHGLGHERGALGDARRHRRVALVSTGFGVSGDINIADLT